MLADLHPPCCPPRFELIGQSSIHHLPGGGYQDAVRHPEEDALSVATEAPVLNPPSAILLAEGPFEREWLGICRCWAAVAPCAVLAESLSLWVPECAFPPYGG